METLKITLSIGIILLLLLTFTSCRKDKNKAADESYFEYNNQKFNITTVQQLNYQGSINLQFRTANAGDYLQLNLAKAGTVLPEGELSYHSNSSSPSYHPTKNFDVIIFGTAGIDHSGTGGTITITKKADGYQFIFNLETNNGKLTGVYNGTPDVF